MAGAAVLRALRTLRPRSPTTVSGSFPTRVESVLPSVWCVSPPAWSPPSVRSLHLCCGLCAGHNKWSKVKHIKGPKDEARGKMFMKFGMMIKFAVKEGGSNPDINLNLAQILEQCKNKNMPKASVEAAIKAAEKAKPAFQHMYEAQGPGGCMLLIEVLTDSNSRCQQDMKRLLLKNGGMMSDKVRNLFKRRGVILVPAQNLSMERALELAIEAGVEDVKEIEDEEEQPLLQFICEMTDLTKARTSLEGLGIQVMSSSLEYFPRTFSSLDQDQLESAATLIEILNDCPEVVRVWDNIQTES